MPDHSHEKPGETIQQTAQLQTSSPKTQWHRSVWFRLMLVAAILSFSTLTFLVETTPSFAVDLQVTRAIQSIDSPLFEALMRLVSWPGFLPQSVLVTLLIGFTFYRFGFRWEALTAVLTAVISGSANELVKSIIQRPRPAVDVVDVFKVLKSYSFPSGHVMFYVSLFGFVWYVAYTLLRRSLTRSLLLIFFGAFISLVGISRIYLGQHWASDVLGAYLLGGLILAGILLFYQWGKNRFFLRQPVAVHDYSKKE